MENRIHSRIRCIGLLLAVLFTCSEQAFALCRVSLESGDGHFITIEQGMFRHPDDPEDEADDEAGPLGAAGAVYEGGQSTFLRQQHQRVVDVRLAPVQDYRVGPPHVLDVVQPLGDVLALPDQGVADHVLVVVGHPLVRAEEGVALLLHLPALAQIQNGAQAEVDQGLL
jgi:hypothetical protein